jgi:hypothetical protein
MVRIDAAARGPHLHSIGVDTMLMPGRVLIVLLFGVLAQGMVAQAIAQPKPAVAEPAVAKPPPTSSQQLLKPEELDQLVAPVALYPDPLLAEVLMSSTYPLEVVQADRWAKQNKNLKGDQLTAALAKQSWDDSVKALVQVPSVLGMMSDQLDWTQKVGNAVLAQQADVMDAVQRLRKQAQAAGKLETTSQQTVTTKSEGQTPYVVIEPSSPSQLYVPYYQPSVVYGAWPHPAYPPYYFPPAPGYVAGGAFATGVAFGAGVALGSAGWGHCDWGRHNINVVNANVNINNFNRNNINNFNKWEHNPDHRQGVQYNNDAVRQKYAKTDSQAGRDTRQDFRGRDGENLDRDRADRDRSGARDGADRGERAGGAGQRSRDNAFSNVDSGDRAGRESERGRESARGGGEEHRAAGGERGGRGRR